MFDYEKSKIREIERRQTCLNTIEGSKDPWDKKSKKSVGNDQEKNSSPFFPAFGLQSAILERVKS